MPSNQILTSLLFDIATDTSKLRSGLDQANSMFKGVGDQINKVKDMIVGAFAVTAIIATTKEVFEFANAIGEANATVRDLTGLMGDDLRDVTASIKATSDTFGTDFNETLKTTNALAHQYGISFKEASELVQQGIALNDDNAESLLGLVKQFSPQFKELGLSAKESFSILTQTLDSGVIAETGIGAIAKANQNLREMNSTAIDALKNIGINGDQLQKQITDGTLTEFQAIQKISGALDGFSNNSQQVGDVLKNVFGKQGVQAGADYIKSLSSMNLEWDKMLTNADEQELATIRIAKAETDLNKTFVAMFGQTSTIWNNLKATALEFAVVALGKVKEAIVGTVNYFIDLYNESLLFKLSIQYIILVFKELWEAVKLVGNLIVDVFSGAGKLIKAIFTADFKSIPQILSDSFKNIGGDFVEFGKSSGENFKQALKNIVSQDKIKLIDLNDAEQQGEDAAKAIKKGMDNASVITPIGELGKSLKPQAAPKQGKALNLKDVDLSAGVNKTAKATKELKTTWEQFGSSMGGVLSQSISGLGQMGASLVGLNNNSKASFKDMVTTILKGIGQIIQGLLAQAMAGLFAKEVSTKGIIGLATAAVGIGLLEALWSQIPAFANGGESQGGLALVGERGAELVNLPAGARVNSNAQSMSMINQLSNNNSSSIGMAHSIQIKGEDLYLMLKRVDKRRGNI